MSNEETDYGEDIAVLKRDVSEIKTDMQSVLTKFDEMRTTKWGPTIGICVAVAGFVYATGGGWVQLKLEPIRDSLIRSEKEIERLKDEMRYVNNRTDTKADKSYVDDKLAYGFHELKNRVDAIKPKQSP